GQKVGSGGADMQLPNSEQTSRPWRIHELTRDFQLLDVWALPTPGGPDDFPRLVEMVAVGDTAESPSLPSRALWALRWKLGEIFGWDDAKPDDLPGWQMLRDRLPEDLRDGPSGPEFATLPFTPVYLLDDEFAAELANKTVHGVMHLSWVPDGKGAYRGQMSVYVKPNGLFGAAYLAAIKPFRHIVVYPAMLRELERRWREEGELGATPA
ncbi:MAG TPA: DUF2867 domain-containing protein, partial [Solirubrobacterales bacterium]|nr:DUF2867 domain-containing protein [Solirubrobacterales bacterium]